MRGGAQSRRLDQQPGALVVGLNVDAEKLVGWRGASFGFQFLQFNGGDINEQAGSVAGYNSIVELPPLNRTELLEAWYLQEMTETCCRCGSARLPYRRLRQRPAPDRARRRSARTSRP